MQAAPASNIITHGQTHLDPSRPHSAAWGRYRSPFRYAQFRPLGSRHNRCQPVSRDPSRSGYPKPTKLDTSTLGHFPATIPAPATNVDFFYRPHFLQGGTLLQLRMCLAPEAITAALNSAQANTPPPADTSKPSTNESTTPPTILFRNASNTDFDDLPKSFRLSVYGSGGSWHHGYSYGVAIDQEASEIIYWFEDW